VAGVVEDVVLDGAGALVGGEAQIEFDGGRVSRRSHTRVAARWSSHLAPA